MQVVGHRYAQRGGPPESPVLEERALGANAEVMFTQLWTCKEAFVRAIGLGLSYPVDRFAVVGAEHGNRLSPSLSLPTVKKGEWSLFAAALPRDCHLAAAVRERRRRAAITRSV